MSRAKIKNKSIEQLFVELRFAPQSQRQTQLDAAEKLLGIIDSNKEYPYEFVCYKITGYRPKTSLAEEQIKGDELKDDLRVFITRLSGQLELAASEQSEKVFSLSELTDKFSVSEKTISRWRKRGLRARKYLFEDGKKRLGFLASDVDDFIETHDQIVNNAAGFSQLTGEQKEHILQLACDISAKGKLSRNQVIDRIVEITSRGKETIRTILSDYEKKEPGRLGLNVSSARLSPKEANLIYKLFKQGTSVPELMKQFGKSKSSIYRIVNKRRARAILAATIKFIESDEFSANNADINILSSDVLENFKTKDDQVLLNRQEEAELFRKYNYLKFLACCDREELKSAKYYGNLLNRIESCLEQAENIKKIIIEANMRLVVSIASKHIGSNQSLQDLVSEGNFSMMRAVEKFDYTRGYRFSTYASWAIAKNFARKIPAEETRPDRHTASDMSNIQQDMRNIGVADISAIEHAQRSLDHIITNNLTEREQHIIRGHFGLDGSRLKRKGKSMKQIGDELGISKERVRQIELEALQKLRQNLGPEEFDLLIG
ncbi:MAG: sigma-70 family RNA polymerase sigma factor [Sedimentisphaerales bacterium]|nr:sigma-70 family RNA polymerase sigma factor [Sedimentisphaerales bacterium]